MAIYDSAGSSVAIDHSSITHARAENNGLMAIHYSANSSVAIDQSNITHVTAVIPTRLLCHCKHTHTRSPTSCLTPPHHRPKSQALCLIGGSCIDERLANRNRKCPACSQQFDYQSVRELYLTN